MIEKRPRIIQFHLHEFLKLKETESRLGVAKAWVMGGGVKYE